MLPWMWRRALTLQRKGFPTAFPRAYRMSNNAQYSQLSGFVFDSALEPPSVVRFPWPRQVQYPRQRECFSFVVRMSSQRHAPREHHPLPCPSGVDRRFCLRPRISTTNCRFYRDPVSVPCHTFVPTRMSPRAFRSLSPFSMSWTCLASFRF